MIEVFKGIVMFFREYMYKEELLFHTNSPIEGINITESATHKRYMMHTGPTTSPENSYTILMMLQQQSRLKKDSSGSTQDSRSEGKVVIMMSKST